MNSECFKTTATAGSVRRTSDVPHLVLQKGLAPFGRSRNRVCLVFLSRLYFPKMGLKKAWRFSEAG